MAKFAVAEFLRRLATAVWTQTYEKVLRGIRWFLVVTFFAVVVATLVECHPFDHYWQVVPDPGPRCRNGFAQVLTMGTADIVTDILLIAFPIPIILRSTMPAKRKMSLVFLFSLSFLLIAITAYRMYAIVDSHGRQQLRTLWASIEILAAAAVSNFLVLGSFVRDRGVRKTRYRPPTSARNDSVAGTETSIQPPSIARKMTLQHWGSDEDLFRILGCRVNSVEDYSFEPTPRAALRARVSDQMVAPDASPEGSSSTLDCDAITVEKVPRYQNSGSNSSDPLNSSDASTRLPSASILFATDTAMSSSQIRTYDFALRPRTPSRGRQTQQQTKLLYPSSIADSPGPPPSQSYHSTATSRDRRPRPQRLPAPALLHHPDYTSYQRSGEDQILGDAGGLLSATPVQGSAMKTRRGSNLAQISQVFEMRSRSRDSRMSRGSIRSGRVPNAPMSPRLSVSVLNAKERGREKRRVSSGLAKGSVVSLSAGSRGEKEQEQDQELALEQAVAGTQEKTQD